MNSFTRFIHQTVIRSNLEEFFVGLRRRVNFFRRFVPLSIRHKLGSAGRFIPQPQSYPSNDSYLLTRDHTHFRINRSDYVQWRLFYGVRDNYLKEAMRLVTPNSIVLDIGANFGPFSLRLASHILRNNYSGTAIYAFEPNPAAVKNMEQNLSLNPKLSTIVKLFPIGLGNEKGKLSFQYHEANSGAGRVMSSQSSHNILIDVDRVDDILSTVDPVKVSFIKMIVEGFEPIVFKGAVKTIEKYRPPIFFEVTPEWYAQNSSSLPDILVPLKQLGYTFYGELHNELIPYDPQKFDNLYQYNIFAIVVSEPKAR